MSRRLRSLILIGFAGAALAACGDSNDPSPRAGGAGMPNALPLIGHTCRDTGERSIDPAAFVDAALLPTLRSRSARVGVAIDARRLGEADYAATAAAHFNYVTPENEMKWDSLEPGPGQFSFARADTVVGFAQQNEMLVKGHTLVWHSQLPAWVNELTGADAVREAMTRHIETVVGHYRDNFPGVVISWDVVNEVIDTPLGVAGYRDSVFYRELGESFIAEAFEIARAADPDALLFYNDFGIEGLGPKGNAAYDMVKGLVDAGVPIDGVGLQMHSGVDNRGPSYDELRTNIQRYADLGLLVNISEMDVNLCGFSNSEFALEAQRFRYNRILQTCLASSACESVALWGVTDKYSWLNERESCTNSAYQANPLAFDDAYQRKPAFWGIYDALDGCFYD